MPEDKEGGPDTYLIVIIVVTIALVLLGAGFFLFLFNLLTGAAC